MSRETCNWTLVYPDCAPSQGSGGSSVDQPATPPFGHLPGDPDAVRPEPLNSLKPEMIGYFEQMAVEFLNSSTNYLFGTCPVEVRPCAERCFGKGSTYWGSSSPNWAPGNWANQWGPVIIGGLWYNLSCSCLTACSCALDGTKTLALPGPVHSIDQILIDGSVIPEESYTLRFGRLLTLIDPDLAWPACQDLNKEITEDGTVAIQYQRGIPVPIGGSLAAGTLALELAKAFCKSNDCQLPQRTQTITRQGVTVGFMDMFDGLEDGKTGIWTIDAWVTSVNRPRDYVSVMNPDTRKSPLQVGNKPWPRT